MTEEKQEKKKEFDFTKRTVEAHGTLSEEESKERAADAEKVSKDMIKKASEAEAKEKSEADAKATEEFEKEESEKKEERKEKERGRGRGKPWQRPEVDTLTGWEPKTKLGSDVKNKKITSIDEILKKNMKVLEPEIIDTLINVKSDLINVGQSKGKFGGGKRRVWRQTQRKTQEGNVPTFSTMAVVGDEAGHIGIGDGKSSETLPARDKATRKAKLNVIRIRRGCAAFDCACSEEHSIPFEVTGKSGSVVVKLIPAPQGTGLVVGNELKKVLKLAGVKDVYSRTTGRKRTTFNLVKACFEALKKTTMREND